MSQQHKDILRLLLPIEIGGVNDADLEIEGAALDRAQKRARDLLNEMQPDTSSEMLADWERVLGLPDPCMGMLTTLQERRAAVMAKWREKGGASRGYFIGVAKKLGYDVTITEMGPFMVGRSAVGDCLSQNADWIHVWRVNAPETTVRYFRAGQSTAGDPLAKWGNEMLECIIRKLKPAHTQVLFGYGG